MKRIFAFALALALLMAMMGCDSSNRSASLDSSASDALSSAGETVTSSQDETSLPEPSVPPREAVTHSWDGADTLYPYAQGPEPLTSTVDPRGESALLTTNLYIRSLEYATGEISVLCNREGCAHDSAECWARKSSDNLFMANGKIYRGQLVEEDEDGYSHMEIYVREAGSIEERKICTVPGKRDPSTGDNIEVLLYGNSAFILSQANQSANDSTTRGFGLFISMYVHGDYVLTELDLLTDTVKQQITLVKGYNVSGWVTCAYGGSIYLATQSWKDFRPLMYLRSSPDRVQSTQEIRYYRYDLESGALEERSDGYPDEFPGQLVPDFQEVSTYPRNGTLHLFPLPVPVLYRPAAILDDWLIYQDTTLAAYNLKTGEERILSETPVRALENGPADVIQLTGPVLYYQGEPEDDFLYRYDFATGEAEQFSLADTNGATLGRIYGEGEKYLFAQLLSARPMYVLVDISQGFTDCPWEKIN